GNERLARRSIYIGAASDAVSPLLLIADLGRPERFLNMLRVFKVTSPMSVGSWILAVSSSSSSLSAFLNAIRRFHRISDAARAVAAGSGAPLAGYTGTLFADTAIPDWHEARRELPFLFGSSAAAIAGGALVLGGEAALRWSVFKAGFQSARDPKYTVIPQRERVAARG